MRLGRIALTVSIGLVALEIGLRVAGFVLLLPATRGNEIRPDDSHKLRILALGESTTAEYFAGGVSESWPSQLETRLNQAGIPTRVYNEGLGGTTTAFILLRLPDYLEKYRPQIVISMMGINDPWNLRYDDSLFTRVKLALSASRVVKLAFWISDAIEANFLSQKMDKTFLPEEWRPLVEDAMTRVWNLKEPEVESWARTKIKDDLTLALFLEEVAVRMMGDFSNFDAISKASLYTRRAFELFPYNQFVAFWQLTVMLDTHATPQECAEVRAKLLKCGPNLSDDILSSIVSCKVEGDDEASSLFRAKRMIVRNMRESPTLLHYRIAHRMIRQQNAVHIAVQYPTLPLKELQHDFEKYDGRVESGFQDLVFVSNFENFADALKIHPYTDLFRDRFRGSWGHTTTLGYKLIADATYPKVLDVIHSHPEWGFSVKSARKSAEESPN